jgi:hypothetical protein
MSNLVYLIARLCIFVPHRKRSLGRRILASVPQPAAIAQLEGLASRGDFRRSRREAALEISPTCSHSALRTRGMFWDCFADRCEGAAADFWPDRHRWRREISRDFVGLKMRKKVS